MHIDTLQKTNFDSFKQEEINFKSWKYCYVSCAKTYLFSLCNRCYWLFFILVISFPFFPCLFSPLSFLSTFYLFIFVSFWCTLIISLMFIFPLTFYSTVVFKVLITLLFPVGKFRTHRWWCCHARRWGNSGFNVLPKDIRRCVVVPALPSESQLPIVTSLYTLWLPYPVSSTSSPFVSTKDGNI